MVFQLVNGTLLSTEELTPVDDIISYELTSAFTTDIGLVGVELNCYDDEDNLMKSATMTIEVKESLSGAGDVIPY